MYAIRSYYVPGIKDLVSHTEQRIENGKSALVALKRLRANPNDAEARATFDASKDDLGQALLLRRYTDAPETADAATVKKAALSTVPDVPVLFCGITSYSIHYTKLYDPLRQTFANARVAQNRDRHSRRQDHRRDRGNAFGALSIGGAAGLGLTPRPSPGSSEKFHGESKGRRP